MGNALKYILRAGKKKSSTYEEDLNKAIEYLRLELSDTNKKEDKKDVTVINVIRPDENALPTYFGFECAVPYAVNNKDGRTAFLTTEEVKKLLEESFKPMNGFNLKSYELTMKSLGLKQKVLRRPYEKVKKRYWICSVPPILFEKLQVVNKIREPYSKHPA